MGKLNVVTVYNYSRFEPGSPVPVVSGSKATREAIARMPDARALEGTEEEVTSDMLDRQGHYRRIATGWGELDDAEA